SIRVSNLSAKRGGGKENKVRVGIIGCGNILRQDIFGCRNFEILAVVAVADLDVSRARAAATEYGIAAAETPAELLADPNVDIVVNLTIPAAHAEVSLAALAAGKHIYSEKPLAITREDGQAILSSARE